MVLNLFTFEYHFYLIYYTYIQCRSYFVYISPLPNYFQGLQLGLLLFCILEDMPRQNKGQMMEIIPYFVVLNKILCNVMLILYKSNFITI